MYLLGIYCIFIVAKSGRPVLGQTQLNSGIEILISYSLSIYSLSTTSKSLYVAHIRNNTNDTYYRLITSAGTTSNATDFSIAQNPPSQRFSAEDHASVVTLTEKYWSLLKPFLIQISHLPKIVFGVNGSNINTDTIPLNQEVIDILRTI